MGQWVSMGSENGAQIAMCGPHPPPCFGARVTAMAIAEFDAFKTQFYLMD